ncbi:peroxisomal sarcosine oxidase [Strongylocentrotus purpuratus]|uniref:sarcosine oxidasee (formaldehyde-forming) n=1 Tax=Strongylocentrotus purpuratus TaxID=7668 RepID=A0A7M7T5Q5_STRPU|nr:peroxisomal sarcosine oxidase [Strongylocentrotus purpuratus]
MMASSSEQFPAIRVHGVNAVYDVVIVGAGIQGSATAYHCVKQGLKTVLLEQFSLPHSRGSSHGQSRIIRYSYKQSHYSEMMSEAFPMWKELEKETSTPLYKQTGLLTISLPPNKGLYESSLDLMRKFQRPHRILDHETRKREYPQLDIPKDALAFLDYGGGTLRADKALRAYQSRPTEFQFNLLEKWISMQLYSICLQDTYKNCGGIIKEEEPVLEITPGTLVTVRTSKGTYRTRHLILTPGAWAQKVLRPLGLDPPLTVTRINVPYWQEKEVGAMSKFPNVIFETENKSFVYGLQELEYPGLTKIPFNGGADTVDPDYRDTVHNEAVGHKSEIEFMKKFIARYFPLLLSEPSIMETCMYTTTPDMELIMDRHPVYPNIIVCCGCSGHGFKLAPSIGKILCRMAMGKEPHIDITALSFKRFSNSCLINKPKL